MSLRVDIDILRNLESVMVAMSDLDSSGVHLECNENGKGLKIARGKSDAAQNEALRRCLVSALGGDKETELYQTLSMRLLGKDESDAVRMKPLDQRTVRCLIRDLLQESVRTELRAVNGEGEKGPISFDEICNEAKSFAARFSSEGMEAYAELEDAYVEAAYGALHSRDTIILKSKEHLSFAVENQVFRMHGTLFKRLAEADRILKGNGDDVEISETVFGCMKGKDSNGTVSPQLLKDKSPQLFTVSPQFLKDKYKDVIVRGLPCRNSEITALRQRALAATKNLFRLCDQHCLGMRDDTLTKVVGECYKGFADVGEGGKAVYEMLSHDVEGFILRVCEQSDCQQLDLAKEVKVALQNKIAILKSAQQEAADWCENLLKSHGLANSSKLLEQMKGYAMGQVIACATTTQDKSFDREKILGTVREEVRKRFKKDIVGEKMKIAHAARQEAEEMLLDLEVEALDVLADKEGGVKALREAFDRIVKFPKDGEDEDQPIDEAGMRQMAGQLFKNATAYLNLMREVQARLDETANTFEISYRTDVNEAGIFFGAGRLAEAARNAYEKNFTAELNRRALEVLSGKVEDSGTAAESLLKELDGLVQKKDPLREKFGVIQVAQEKASEWCWELLNSSGLQNATDLLDWMKKLALEQVVDDAITRGDSFDGSMELQFVKDALAATFNDKISIEKNAAVKALLGDADTRIETLKGSGLFDCLAEKTKALDALNAAIGRILRLPENTGEEQRIDEEGMRQNVNRLLGNVETYLKLMKKVQTERLDERANTFEISYRTDVNKAGITFGADRLAESARSAYEKNFTAELNSRALEVLGGEDLGTAADESAFVTELDGLVQKKDPLREKFGVIREAQEKASEWCGDLLKDNGLLNVPDTLNEMCRRAMSQVVENAISKGASFDAEQALDFVKVTLKKEFEGEIAVAKETAVKALWAAAKKDIKALEDGGAFNGLADATGGLAALRNSICGILGQTSEADLPKKIDGKEMEQKVNRFLSDVKACLARTKEAQTQMSNKIGAFEDEYRDELKQAGVLNGADAIAAEAKAEYGEKFTEELNQRAVAVLSGKAGDPGTTAGELVKEIDESVRKAVRETFENRKTEAVVAEWRSRVEKDTVPGNAKRFVDELVGNEVDDRCREALIKLYVDMVVGSLGQFFEEKSAADALKIAPGTLDELETKAQMQIKSGYGSPELLGMLDDKTSQTLANKINTLLPPGGKDADIRLCYTFRRALRSLSEIMPLLQGVEDGQVPGEVPNDNRPKGFDEFLTKAREASLQSIVSVPGKGKESVQMKFLHMVESEFLRLQEQARTFSNALRDVTSETALRNRIKGMADEVKAFNSDIHALVTMGLRDAWNKQVLEKARREWSKTLSQHDRDLLQMIDIRNVGAIYTVESAISELKVNTSLDDETIKHLTGTQIRGLSYLCSSAVPVSTLCEIARDVCSGELPVSHLTRNGVRLLAELLNRWDAGEEMRMRNRGFRTSNVKTVLSILDRNGLLQAAEGYALTSSKDKRLLQWAETLEFLYWAGGDNGDGLTELSQRIFGCGPLEVTETALLTARMQIDVNREKMDKSSGTTVTIRDGIDPLGALKGEPVKLASLAQMRESPSVAYADKSVSVSAVNLLTLFEGLEKSQPDAKTGTRSLKVPQGGALLRVEQSGDGRLTFFVQGNGRELALACPVDVRRYAEWLEDDIVLHPAQNPPDVVKRLLLNKDSLRAPGRMRDLTLHYLESLTGTCAARMADVSTEDLRKLALELAGSKGTDAKARLDKLIGTARGTRLNSADILEKIGRMQANRKAAVEAVRLTAEMENPPVPVDRAARIRAFAAELVLPSENWKAEIAEPAETLRATLLAHLPELVELMEDESGELLESIRLNLPAAQNSGAGDPSGAVREMMKSLLSALRGKLDGAAATVDSLRPLLEGGKLAPELETFAGQVDACGKSVLASAQTFFNAEFVKPIEDAIPPRIPLAEQTLDELAGAESIDPTSGYGKFLVEAFKGYFAKAEGADRRKLLAMLLRHSGANATAAETFSALVRGAGPVFQKLLQGVPAESVPLELRPVLDVTKSSLDSVPPEVVRAQLWDLVVCSGGAVTGIEVVKSLGAASVGEALLCRIRTKENPDGDVCVVKLLRGDVQNRALREISWLKGVAKDIPGMAETFEGRSESILTEFDLSGEARNVLLGGVYNPDGKDGSVSRVRSMSLMPRVTSASGAIVLTKADGVTYDQMVRDANAGIDGIVSKFRVENRTNPDDVYAEYKTRSVFDQASARDQLTACYEQLRTQHDLLVSLSGKWIEEAVFKSGFYHGDLHAGNIMAGTEGLTLIDFGNVSQLADKRRDNLMAIVVAGALDMPDLLMTSFMGLLSKAGKARLGEKIGKDGPTVEDQIRSDVEIILGKGTASELPQRLMAVVRRIQGYGVEVPPELFNFVQSLARLRETLVAIEHTMDRASALYADLSVGEKPEDMDPLEKLFRPLSDAWLKLKPEFYRDDDTGETELAYSDEDLEAYETGVRKFLSGFDEVPGQPFSLAGRAIRDMLLENGQEKGPLVLERLKKIERRLEDFSFTDHPSKADASNISCHARFKTSCKAFGIERAVDNHTTYFIDSKFCNFFAQQVFSSLLEKELVDNTFSNTSKLTEKLVDQAFFKFAEPDDYGEVIGEIVFKHKSEALGRLGLWQATKVTGKALAVGMSVGEDEDRRILVKERDDQYLKSHPQMSHFEAEEIKGVLQSFKAFRQTDTFASTGFFSVRKWHENEEKRIRFLQGMMYNCRRLRFALSRKGFDLANANIRRRVLGFVCTHQGTSDGLFDSLSAKGLPDSTYESLRTDVKNGIKVNVKKNAKKGAKKAVGNDIDLEDDALTKTILLEMLEFYRKGVQE